MLGCIGDDDFGKIQSISLNSSRVDVTAFKISKLNPTGTAVIYVDAQANNSIVVIQGANCECDIAYLEEQGELIEDCDYVLLQMEIPLETIYYVVKRARKLGKTVILNPAPDELTDEILKCIDYITPNETELEKLTGSDSRKIESIRDGAKTLLEKGVKNVIVTIGERGTLMVNQEGAQKSIPVREEVDIILAGSRGQNYIKEQKL